MIVDDIACFRRSFAATRTRVPGFIRSTRPVGTMMSPSTKVSSMPVTVTICGVFQLTLVKVRLAAEAYPSEMSLLARGTMTSAVGQSASLPSGLSRASRCSMPSSGFKMGLMACG